MPPPQPERMDGQMKRADRRRRRFRHHPHHGTAMSEQDLIRRLLTVDPKKRMTAAQAVTHPWLLSRDSDLLNRNLGVNLEQLKLFNARRKLRAAIKSVSRPR
ncbi:unnamed protein product, partial [Hapterophycus canaliculatus]